MYLRQLSLRNFRCFESLEIDFHPNVTVLIASNGSGKTTVLDAARVALWPFVKGFDLGSQTGKGATIQISDVRLALQVNGNMEPQLPSKIEGNGKWNETEQPWLQTRERIKSGTNTLGDANTKKLTKFANYLEKRSRDDQDPVILPLVSYLGTSRLWFEGRFTSTAEDVALNTSDYSRTSGYLNCLSYSSSFKTFTAWYGWMFRSYREEQILAIENKESLSDTGKRFAIVIEVIKNAVDALVKEATGWHGLEYKASQNQQLVMTHERFGSMPVEMLSDGIRNAIAMVADLAFRAYKLNPHLGVNAALLTPGIAMIDEVDMFLHPAWQQTIIASLLSAFPKIQFIVSTHSPQVLSTVPSECIRILKDGKVYSAPPGSEGAEPGRLLKQVLGLEDARPFGNEATKELREYLSLVDKDQWDSPRAKELRQKLDARYQGNEPELQEADLRIENRKWELGE
ncbi:AAA family ATPase [Chitinibacter fontanus]|uniref:AAA family ATPase n=1 Tax=Chitinibacter fontanus TaxID=1737446 RepID=A0A7D5V8U6_9NEIS|nr:AAA family ATPase [Chitinibacter fontanus]QLI80854.1 AAA family ATPase [Chitinibacter fontanus]